MWTSFSVISWSLVRLVRTVSRQVLNVSEDGDSTTSGSNLFHCLTTLAVDVFFLYLSEISNISFCTCCPVVLSLGTTEMGLALSLFPSFPGQVLMHYRASTPNSHSSNSLFWYDSLSPSSFLWSFPCLLYWGAQNWMQPSRCVSLDLSRKER